MRLDLKDTPMYTTALGFVRGKGGNSGVSAGRASTGLDIDSIPGPLKAPELVVVLRDGSQTASNKGFGAGKGVTPPDQPGGPGATESDTVLVDREAMARQLEMARLQTQGAKERLSAAQQNLDDATRRRTNAEAGAADAQARIEAAETAFRDLQQQLQALDPNDADYEEQKAQIQAQMVEAQEQQAAAQQALDTALEAVRAAEAAELAARDALHNAQKDLEGWEEAVKRLQSESGLVPTETVEPVTAPYSDRVLNSLRDQYERSVQRFQDAQTAAQEAKQNFEQLQQQLEGNPGLAQDEAWAAQYQQALENRDATQTYLQEAQADREAKQVAYNDAEAANQAWHESQGG
jgi:chromosome segregation ATPase